MKHTVVEKENHILRNEIEQMKKEIKELQDALKANKH